MVLFPAGSGGGEEVAYGRKGKGILIHTLTEGSGMPLANSTTAAQSLRLKSRRRSDACLLRSEREQIFPLLDSVKLKTLKRGRAKKRVKVLAADKGYDSKEKRTALRKRGIRPQLPKRSYKTKKNLGRPIKISVPRFRAANAVLRGLQRKYRRLVVRWERKKTNFDAFLSLATIHIWINKMLLVG